MGRHPVISSEKLCELTKKFWQEEAKGNPGRMKIAEIGRYVRSHGFPNVNDPVIARNASVRQYIEESISKSKNEDYLRVSVYKTLDVEQLFERNNSVSSLKKVLTEREQYYKSLSEAAARALDQNDDLKEENNHLKLKLDDIMISNEQNESTIENLSRENKQLQADNKKLRNIIDIYVYPEIANELLKKQGLLYSEENKSIVKRAAVEEQLITPITNVKTEANPNPTSTKVRSGSSVIQGLFDKFSK